MAQKIVNKTLCEGMIGEFVDASPRRTFKTVVNTRDNANYGSAFFKTEGGWTITDSGVENVPMAFSVNPKEDCLKSLRGMDGGGYVAPMNDGKCECALCTMGRVWLGIMFMKGDEEGVVPITDLDEARKANILGYEIASGNIVALTGDEAPEEDEVATINGFVINRINALAPDAGLYLCEVEITNPVFVELGA